MKTKKQVLDWLLEENNTPVRYLTQTQILKKSLQSLEVKKTRQNLLQYNPTKKILERSDEFLNTDQKNYWKYKGKYWQLIFLGQFLADGKDPRVNQGVQSILNQKGWISKSGGQCLTANLLAAFWRLGFGNNPIVIKETESLANRIVSDGGLKCEVMDYSLLSKCYMALPKQLLLFAEIPKENRSPSVKLAIEKIIKTILQNQVYVYIPSHRKEWQKIFEKAPKRADLPKGQTVIGWVKDQKMKFLETYGIGKREEKKGWLKFGFPLHYNSDILETMYALSLHKVPMSSKLKVPLEKIKSKMTIDGTWVLENSLNGKMLADVEKKGQTSKWITFFALKVLTHFKQ